MASTGGSQPVTLDAPVMASRRGRGSASRPATTSSTPKVPVAAALDVAPPGHPAPGQQVGVVLDHGGEHDVVGVEAQPVGQLVDGLGGVPADDGHVVAAAAGSPAKARARGRADS